MRIFSNFDTKLKREEFDSYKKKFGKENVILVSKWGLFRFLKLRFPLFFFLIVSLWALLAVHTWLDEKFYYFGVIPLVVLMLFYMGPRYLKALIDYHMDFLIVTPYKLVRYDQTGLFHRDVISINVNSIKTVSVKKKWIIYSLFDDGDIVFLSEWDVTNGEIMMKYINDPEWQKKKISDVMRRDWRPKPVMT